MFDYWLKLLVKPVKSHLHIQFISFTLGGDIYMLFVSFVITFAVQFLHETFEIMFKNQTVFAVQI